MIYRANIQLADWNEEAGWVSLDLRDVVAEQEYRLEHIVYTVQ